jgi:5-methylcytosine-specific restriction endonuclease McrA
MEVKYLDEIFKENLLKINSHNYKEYKYTFSEFLKIIDNNYIKTPIFQSVINEDKVNEMIFSYKNNPEFFNFKNKIVLCYIPSSENNIYIMDGQHRIEMIKELHNLNYDDFIYICCYIIQDEEKVKLLYDELNKDSYKNMNYVFLDDFSKELHNKFVDYLRTNYLFYFEKKQKRDAYRKTITEFLNDVEDKNYLLKFNSFNDLKEDFENANFTYNYLIKYKVMFANNDKIFYKDEHDCVSNGIVFTLRNNNFTDYLLNRNITPHHKFKKEKKRITKKLKKEVWIKEFGNKKEGKCPYKSCKNIIYEKDYSCGHVISEYNGGETTIKNLRPMCYGCNNKLGKRNWT